VQLEPAAVFQVTDAHIPGRVNRIMARDCERESPMRAFRRLLAASVLAWAAGCSDSVPVLPTSPSLPSSIQVFRDQKGEFDNAVRELGTRTVIDFEDIEARPISDTIEGRTPFDGLRYASRGMVFSNPNSVPLYIAPGGLFWNPTNSLSIGRFPFDPLDVALEAPFIEDDDLVATFEPGCSAAAFSVIDKGAFSAGDVVQALDTGGGLIQSVAFPQTFLGIVSRGRAIARFLISEAANDLDDVTYDDFVCVQ
jgi:hypothetical protein